MAILKTYNLTLDLINEQKTPKIVFKQSDYKSAKLVITVTNNGAKTDLTGYTAKVSFQKKDKTKVYQDATITSATNGVLEVVLNSQTLALPREVEGEVELTAIADGSVVVTTSFNFKVEDAIVGTVQSVNDIPLFQELKTSVAEKAKSTDVNNSLANKVDKITGKGLSTNDYDNVEKAEVAKIKGKADTSYVDTKVAAVASGSPKGTYATLAALQTAFPTGNTNIYVVTADGKWYYWNGTAWTAGGTYQATGIADKSITPMHAIFQQIDLGTVTWTPGLYIGYANGNQITHADQSLNASSFIPVTGGLKYIVRTCTNADQSGMAWYDATGKYIGGMQTGASTSVMTDTEFTLPSNATQVRLTCYGSGKIPNVMLAIKSNPLDIGNVLTQPYTDRLSSLEKQSSSLSAGLFRSYIINSGDITDVPTLFNQVLAFGGSNGTITRDAANYKIIATSVTSKASGGAGFQISLPKLTPELIKSLKTISLEFDVDMATPIQLGFNVDLYAMRKSNGSNTNTPPVSLGTVLLPASTQHVSKLINLDYDTIASKMLSNDNIAMSDIGHFDIYLHYLDLFSNNTITFSNIYFKLVNTTDTRLTALESSSSVGNNNTALIPGENPLATIKRDGGLYGILQNVAFIGDSLSSGEHEYTKGDGTTGYIDLYNNSYGQIAARITGTKAVNWSSGGLTAAAWLTKYQNTAFLPDQLSPAYVIYLGTNDQDSSKNTYGMGDVSTDVNKSDYTKNGLSFAGRYATIIQKIKEAQPKARIFLVTLPKGATGTSDSVANPIIRQIADLWKDEFVYLLDLQAYAPNITADYRIGGHLTTMGYMVFAWHVMSYIDYIIRQKPMDFKEVAFIGTTYHNNAVTTTIK